MANNQIRIIGGQWRGTKLSVIDGAGLRPTPARVRETLFNWLQHEIRGAHCLDLFAGSGALGLEAASRGAASVMLVDNNRLACEQLQSTINKLGSEQVSVQQTSSQSLLNNPLPQFDVVFLDPPFQSDLLASSCAALEKHHCLTEHAKIYVEIAKNSNADWQPANWINLRSKIAGDVSYSLFQRQASSPSSE